MAPARAREETREAWYGIEDRRKRKQIQDRIAQRARRKRLAEANINTAASLVRSIGPTGPPRNIAGPESGQVLGFHTIVPKTVSINANSSHHAPSPSHLSQCAAGFLIISPIIQTLTGLPLPIDQRLLIDPNSSALVAFGENGHRMGIGCCCIGLVRSWRHPPDLPDSLQPTPLQLTTAHPIWIDRLPFPRMRDNVILLANMINLEEFYVDLIINRSFQVKPGMPPHDPNAYRIDPAFRSKWGYLFH